jgi:hypothetical protein
MITWQEFQNRTTNIDVVWNLLLMNTIVLIFWFQLVYYNLILKNSIVSWMVVVLISCYIITAYVFYLREKKLVVF